MKSKQMKSKQVQTIHVTEPDMRHVWNLQNCLDRVGCLYSEIDRVDLAGLVRILRCDCPVSMLQALFALEEEDISELHDFLSRMVYDQGDISATHIRFATGD